MKCFFIMHRNFSERICTFLPGKVPSATITPKMHMMLKHLPPQMRKWNFGMGFLGAESIHASFNSIERVYSGIPNKVDRLLWLPPFFTDNS